MSSRNPKLAPSEDDFVHSESVDTPYKQEINFENLPAGYYRSKNFLGSLMAVCLMALSLYLGFTLPVNSLIAINAELGPDPNYNMISTVSTLLAGVGILPVGRLGDILGRRYFLIGGQLLGLVGASICATAKDIPTVVGGSVLTGLAASVQLTFTFVIAELVPNKLRPIVNSGIFITTIPFGAFGGLIAQLFIANTNKGWRWSYYLSIICCGLSTLLFIVYYFPPGWDEKQHGKSRLSELKDFDYMGFVLYSAGFILIFLGLSWGGGSYSWSSAHTVTPLVVGFVTLAAFVLYEIFGNLSQPLVPMSLLKSRGYNAAVCAALVGNMVFFSMSLLWPQLVAALFTKDPIKTGWLSISTSTGVIIGEIFAGILMKPLGHTKCQLIASTVLVTTFSGALAATNQYRQSYGLAFTAIGGFAVGYLESITIVMCPLYCKPEDIGLASGFLGSTKQICGTIATSIYIAVLHSRVAVNLPRDVSAAALNAGLPKSSISDFFDAFSVYNSSAIERVPGVTNRVIVAATDASKTAYSQSFRTVFLVSITFGCLSTIAALLSISVDDKLDNAVAARLLGTHSSQETINNDQEK